MNTNILNGGEFAENLLIYGVFMEIELNTIITMDFDDIKVITSLIELFLAI